MFAPIALLTVFLTVAGPIPGTPPSSGRFGVDIERVSDRVMVARSAYGPNVSAIKTDDGLVIVDTHLSPGTMEVFLAALQAESGADRVAHVVNTHGHWDHCSGNQVFGDAIIAGHVSMPAYMSLHRADDPRIVLRKRQDAERVGEGGGSDDETTVINRIIAYDLENRYRSTPPSVTFSDRYELIPGENGVVLVRAGVLHTPTDILVYVAGDGVLFTGDLFSSPHSFSFPIWALSEVGRLLETLQHFLDRGVDVVVPGHGETMTGKNLEGLYEELSRRWTEAAARRSAAVYLHDRIARLGPDLAIGEFRTADDKTGFGELSQDEFYLLANRYSDGGEPAAAKAVFELTLDLFGEDPVIWSRLGDVCLAAGDTLSAVSAYDRVCGLAPARPHPYETYMLELLAGE